ncbi:putative pentatricopeptide repeat-containing protein At3g01580 [Aristolochia californica]|uniref:putative pentatricopeptide repeat-containing protein At3g01580 n=1 Tax=Aristolochia californica TaxID=171875 RepID=UPI0035DD4DCC
MKNRLFLSQLFEICSNEKSLASLHSFLLKAGFAHDSLFATKLTAFYGKLGCLENAHQLFEETPHRTTFLYNAILRAYLKAKQWKETLFLFRHMHSFSTERPDGYTIPIAIKACVELSAINAGQAIHSFIKKKVGIDSDKFVGVALMELYAKFGDMEGARRVFSEFAQPDVVMWTSMVTWYVQNGDAKEALLFFYQMVMTEGVMPDRVTLVSAVSACAQSENFKYGSCCHGFVFRRSLLHDLPLVNALLNFYAKVGYVHYAKTLFSSIPVKDVITWSCMIACFVQNEKPTEALALFDDMVEKGFEPNSVTTVNALQACAATCDLVRGKKIHELATQKGFELDIAVSTALVDMYMKCSCLENAVILFNKMPDKDVISWSALISGYAQNGLANESINTFRSMLLADISPDAVTIVKILASSSLLGVLRQALCLHGYLVARGFEDKLFVRAALIDLYAKCGTLDNAVRVFEGTQDRDVVVWSSIIAAYGIHGRGYEAIDVFKGMVEDSCNPNPVTFVSILSACSHAGLVEEGIMLFNNMLSSYGVAQNWEHYGIMVDLLCRKGDLEKAMKLISQMPTTVGPHVWGALLGGCRIHKNVNVGEIAARTLFKIEPDHVGYYILLSNIYANEGRWDKAAEVRRMIKGKGLKKIPGLSSIELGNGINTFQAGDKLHPESDRIYGFLKELERIMREEGYVPEPMFMLQGIEEMF